MNDKINYIIVGEFTPEMELPYWNDSLGWTLDFFKSTLFDSNILDQAPPPILGSVGIMKVNTEGKPFGFYPLTN